MNNRIDQKNISDISDSPKPALNFSKNKDSDNNFDNALKDSQEKLDQINFNPWLFAQSIFSYNFDNNFNGNISQDYKIEKYNRTVFNAYGNNNENTHQTQNNPEFFGNFDAKQQFAIDQNKRQIENNFKNGTVNNILGSSEIFFSLRNFISEFKNDLLLKKIDIEALSNEIIDKVKMYKDKEKTELSIELSPKELGSVLLNISSKSGIISINITAAQNVADALNKQINELEEILKKASISVGNLSVSVGGDKKDNFDQNTNFEWWDKIAATIQDENNPFTTFEDSYILSRKLGYLNNLGIFFKI